MDFASLLSSQIAASKSPPNTESRGNKYLKRGEIEAQREATYKREQAELERARLERLEKKRKREEEDAERNQAREEKRRRLAEESRRRAEEEREVEERERRRKLGLPELVKEGIKDETRDGEGDLGEEELLEKLRELGEPRKLFGETHPQRLKRYRKLTSRSLAPKMTDGPIPTTLSLLPEADMKVPPTVPSCPSDQEYLRRQIASYFTLLLTAWSAALSTRPKEVKESFSGKAALNSHLTAISNLTPLFRRLESPTPATLPLDLLQPITEIVHLAQLKRYVDANDAYLRLSIGKAAWPIGVTMVGIHERSAREKLHETEKGAEKAHILADEVTRKMLQGIKRCLSFAQVRWPPGDGGQVMG